MLNKIMRHLKSPGQRRLNEKIQKAFDKFYEDVETSKTYPMYQARISKRGLRQFNLLCDKQFDYLEDCISNLKSETVFDLGVGNGELLNYCFPHSKKSGIEISKVAAKIAREKNIQVEALALESLDISKFEIPFDLIFCVDSFYNIKDRPDLLKRINKMMGEGSHFVLFHSFYNLKDQTSFESELKKEGLEYQVHEFDFDQEDFWQYRESALLEYESGFFEEGKGQLYKILQSEILKNKTMLNENIDAKRVCYIIKKGS